MGTLFRLIGAFVAAVLAIGITASLMVLPFEPHGAWLAGKIAMEIALVVAVALGIPAHATLSLAKRTGWQSYLAAGSALAGAVTLVFVALGFNEFPAVFSIAGLALLFGLVGSLTFWVVARPDRGVRPHS